MSIEFVVFGVDSCSWTVARRNWLSAILTNQLSVYCSRLETVSRLVVNHLPLSCVCVWLSYSDRLTCAVHIVLRNLRSKCSAPLVEMRVWRCPKPVAYFSAYNLLLSTPVSLTPSTPAVSNCCCSKAPAPYWSNPPFLIFDIQSWAPERPNVKN